MTLSQTENRPFTESCRHCGEPIPQVRRRSAAPDFCCTGCSSVYEYLRELQFDQTYYSIKETRKGGLKPSLESGEDYSALDLPPYRSETGGDRLEIFVEGIHCAACVWVLERLPEMGIGVLESRLDAGRSLLTVRVSAQGRFAEVAQVLLRLGYRPHAVRSSEEAKAKLVESDQRTLKRMGVAAFSAMNVMIYSVALYSGVTGGYATLFQILSLMTALPALTYSAWPFYMSAIRALRGRRVSIDLPISIAFVFGFLESVRQVALGTNFLYLDSVTGLVFLMLASRYALSRLERAELSRAGILQALLPSRVSRMTNSWTVEKVRADEVKVGDRLLLGVGEKVLADGCVESGKVWIDLSFLTGETKPVPVGRSETLLAGSRITEGECVVRVFALGKDTRLGEIEGRLEWSPPKSNHRVVRSDLWAQMFLAIVLGLGGVLFFAFGFENFDEAARRSLSLLIIACPCALALATPLTLARAFRLAAGRGILVRDLDAFDRVLESDRIVFDKTGTLTTGRPSVSHWYWEPTVRDEEKSLLLSIAYSLEVRARHPYGKAIVRELQNDHRVGELPEIVAQEEMGRGASATYLGREYRIARAENPAHPGVEYRRDGELVAFLDFEDEIRPESAHAVGSFRARGLAAEIVSGDASPVVHEVAQRLGITEWRARMTPEDKAALFAAAEYSASIAIGDGVNDALALKTAFVGIGFSRGGGEALESTLASSDVVILRADLGLVVDFVDIARTYRRTLNRNAVFSVIYNLVGASFAVLGFVHPLVAAVAMPVSALTVFLSTAIGLREKPKRSGQ